jgi:hypothetical protein
MGFSGVFVFLATQAIFKEDGGLIALAQITRRQVAEPPG